MRLQAQDGFTGLGMASQKGHLETARLLLEHRADVNAWICDAPPSPWLAFTNSLPPGKTSLYIAAANGHVEVAQLLLDRGACVDMADGVRQPRERRERLRVCEG